MGIVVVPTYGSDPATVNAANLDAKVSGLATEFNGGIDNDNIDPAAAIAATKLSLATIAQAIAMSSKTFQFAKGADVASASSIALGTDGNFFDITGTTTIQTITAKQAGCIVALHFDGALTLTDDTGNLELNGSDVIIAAEDNVILGCDGTNWHLLSKYPATPSNISVTSAPSDQTVSGVKMQLTANENQTFGDACYINTDGEAQIGDADAIASSKIVCMCSDATISADATGNYLMLGTARDDTAWAWTVGGFIYLTVTGTTTNTLSQTAPTGADDCVVILGVATHADRMYFNPSLSIVEHTG